MRHKTTKNRKTFVLPLLGLLLTAAATAVVCIQLTRAPAPQPSQPPTQMASGPVLPAPEETEATSQSPAETVPPSPAGYDYAKPVPLGEKVADSYFDDAVFIGDSRTQGLMLYTGLSNATVYANQGLMVDTVFTRPVIQLSGQKLSVVEALKQTAFRKVYIMLGINETGWAYESVFIEKYQKLIEEIRGINPQAVVYIQQILPVTAQTSRTHSYVTNEKIQRYNQLLAQLAEKMQVYYIDTGSAVADETGCLPEEAALDGIHLKKPYCDKWLDYLKTHTVNPETGGQTQ